MSETPIIIALDFENETQARELVEQLGYSAGFYKVGMELYAAAGMQFVRELIHAGKQVFLDLKLYDIPETVKRATAQIADSEARFLTVHGSNAIMQAAVTALNGSKLELLAVTVLTSFDHKDLADLGYECAIGDLVALRVRNALAAGIHGIVCSALDAAMVREIAGAEATLVTPGVRSHRAPAGDQKRVATPLEAIEAGANYVVIGRQVTRSADPRSEMKRILEEIGNARVSGR